MIETGLYTFITSSPEFVALAETRLYPVILPEEVTFPAATYQRITTTRIPTTTGPVTLNRIRMQFDIWSGTYNEAKQLQTVLLAILEDPTNYKDGIDSITLYSANDDYSSDAQLYRVSMDFMVFAAE